MIQHSRGQGDQELISFVLDLDEDVSVVGDFNNWDPYAHPLLRSSTGQRTATVALPPGSYAFRYLAAGGRFFDDADADAYVDNGNGDVNGVLEVSAPPDAPRKHSDAPPAKKPTSSQPS
jgi:1,4-alpha-glucan branching enzyme